MSNEKRVSVMRARLHNECVKGNPFYGDFKKIHELKLEFIHDKYDYPAPPHGVQFSVNLRGGKKLDCFIPKFNLEYMEQLDGEVYRCVFNIETIAVVVEAVFNDNVLDKTFVEIYDNPEDFDEGHPTQNFILYADEKQVLPLIEDCDVERHYFAKIPYTGKGEEIILFVEMGKDTDESARTRLKEHIKKLGDMGYETDDGNVVLKGFSTETDMADDIGRQMFNDAQRLHASIRLVESRKQREIVLVSGYICIEKEQEVVIQTYEQTDDEVIEGIYNEFFGMIGSEGILGVYLIKGKPNDLPKEKLDKTIKNWQQQGKIITFAVDECVEDEE